MHDKDQKANAFHAREQQTFGPATSDRYNADSAMLCLHGVFVICTAGNVPKLHSKTLFNHSSRILAMPLLLTVRTDSSDEGLSCRSLSVQGLLPEFVATQSLAAIKQLPSTL